MGKRIKREKSLAFGKMGKQTSRASIDARLAVFSKDQFGVLGDA